MVIWHVVNLYLLLYPFLFLRGEGGGCVVDMGYIKVLVGHFSPTKHYPVNNSIA